MSRITQPANGDASIPSSSPGSHPKGQSAVCQAPRPWEDGDGAEVDYQPNNHWVLLLTLCSSLMLSTTKVSMEQQEMRTLTRRKPTTTRPITRWIKSEDYSHHQNTACMLHNTAYNNTQEQQLWLRGKLIQKSSGQQQDLWKCRVKTCCHLFIFHKP